MSSAPQSDEKRHQDNGSSWQQESFWLEAGPGLLETDWIDKGPR